MPFNVTSPNSALFGVQFTDQYGTPVTPSSAAITLVYNIAGVSNSSTADLTSSGGRWVYTWSSVGVDVPSDVLWTVISSCSSPNPAQIGTLRIIDP